MGTSFLAMWAVSAAFKALDDYTHQYSRSLEEASRASGEYETQKNHVQQLTSEYDTLQDKIKQLKSLQANETITMAQEIELSNLQNQSEELERQLDIQKQLLDIKSKTSADAAKNASEKEMSYIEMNQEKYGKVKGYWEAFKGLFDTGFGEYKISEYDKWKESDTTQSGLIKRYLTELSGYEEQLTNVQEKLRKDANNAELLQDEKDLNEKILDTKQQLSSGIDTIQKWISQSLDENGLPIKGSERFVESLRDIVTEYQNFGKSTKEVALNNLNNYFSSISGSSMKKYLEDIVKNGGSAKDALKAFRDSGMRLKDIDVSQSVFLRYFEDIKKSAKEAEEAINSVDGTFSGVNEAFESENQGASYDKMLEYFKTSKELNKNGLWGTDDFQTIAQFGVRYDIGKKLKENADAYTYASDAYVEAYNKALPLLERWYGNENELANMNNILADFTNKGLARDLGNGEYQFLDENQKPLFENTAQAAQKLETSVENVELVMRKLEEHGFEFDGIERSADQLSRYKSSLEGLHSLVEDMKDGSQKERVMKLLPGWDEELEKFKDPNYLATLTEDQILKIEFEYDLAQLQQQLNEALELAQATGDNQDWAAARLAAKNIREHYESQTGYDENYGDVGYTNSYKKIDELSSSMNGESEEFRAEVNEKIASLMQLQNAFQDFRLGGGQLNWNEFINSDGASDALNNIIESTNLTKEQIAELLNVDVEDLHFDVDADTSKAESKIDEIAQKEFEEKIVELTATDNATPYLQLWNELQANPKFTELNAVDQASYVIQLWNALTPEQKEAYLNGEITVVDQATGTVQTVEGALESLPLSPQAVISATNNTGTVVLNARTALDNIDGKTVNTYIVTHRKTVIDGEAELNGTAHKNGTVGGLYPIPKLSHRALALGSLQDTSWLKPNWKTKETETALTGELGQEIVVHGNRWWTVGDNGAEFSTIPKGSVIFNHKQSKELLTKGFTNSRAKSYAHGTAFASGGRLPFASGGNGGSKNTSNSSKSEKNSKDEAKSFMEQLKERFGNFFDWIEIRLNLLNRNLDKHMNKFNSEFIFDESGEHFVNSMNAIKQSIEETAQARDRYLSHAQWVASTSGMSADLQNRIQLGAIDINEYDSDTQIQIEEYKKWYDKMRDCEDALDDLIEKQSDLVKQNFDKLTTNYENQLSQLSHAKDMIDSAISLTEAKGHLVGETYYKELISLENSNLSKLQEEYASLTNELAYAMDSGNIEKYSEAWYDMVGEINNVESAIIDAENELQNFSNSIRDLQWETFDFIADSINDTVDEMDFIVDLLSHKDLFTDKGIMTNEGITTLGQYASKYNLNMGLADKYKSEIDKLNKALSKDPYNKDLIDRRKELIKLQQESIKNAEDEKEAMIDLIREGVEKQIDAMQELIDKKVEALEQEKKLYDYRKTIEEKANKVSDIEKQLSSVSGDDSEENMKRIQELKSQLESAKEDLKETEYNQWISDQKDLMDELLTNYSDTLNAQFDNIDFLIANLIDYVNANSGTITETINGATNKVGYEITEGMSSIWNSNSGISNIVSNYASNFNSHSTTIQGYLKQLVSYVQQMQARAEAEAQAKIEAQKAQQQATQNPKPTATPQKPQPTPPKNNNSGGDGKPRVGDRVTLKSGQQYYSTSWGGNPIGRLYSGVKNGVIIDSLSASKYGGSNRTTGNYDVHIKSADGKYGDLGWVRLDQIEGYRKGTNRVPNDNVYWTNENGSEIIYRKSDGAMLTPLNTGDKVINAAASENLYKFANNPNDFIKEHLSDIHNILPSAINGGIENNIDVDINIDHVQDYNDFVRQARQDPNFEKLVQAMTVEQLSGRSKFGKYNIKF